ncbi:MAG: hypothetical protein HN352_12795 [Bacteroidetes bacterium]|jgi:hypothetical protein|nr:hypothetical protein [Bacteroidota bacterium]MBT3750591.1 hypothetical protein [Bacteroidota bacterium]MBT4399101.1 hypothetical protein [Bacteroidota bacterium]MBT4408936.1 hypothetical protein [Bacteroidota bacterium]MBT7465124.1 hypothetical protein [Bacteroidota bacterium]
MKLLEQIDIGKSTFGYWPKKNLEEHVAIKLGSGKLTPFKVNSQKSPSIWENQSLDLFSF